MRYLPLVVCITLLLSSTTAIADSKLWQPWSSSDSSETKMQKQNPSSRLFIKLDHEQMQQRLSQISTAVDYAAKNIDRLNTIQLPLLDGSSTEVSVSMTEVLSPELQQKFPDIHSYKITAGNNSVVMGRLDISAQGFHAMINTAEGEVIYIDPAYEIGADAYQVYSKSSQGTDITPHQCELDLSELGQHDNEQQTKQSQYLSKPPSQYPSQYSAISSDTAIYKYRIAVSATGEYTAQHGGTKASAMAAIASTINRINQIYERDAAIHFELVANNDQLIFRNSSNDPFSGTLTTQLRQNQDLITEVIGENNYDIGHLFTTRGGGLAFVGGACRANSKAMGVSGYSSGSRFDLAFVAHEIGHQFSATHTFSGDSGHCGGGNRYRLSAYEPGSGSTIMSYVGICGSDNLQSRVDGLFHIGSIQQIQAHKQAHLNNGCGEVFHDGFSAPEVNAGEDYTIPANTPFTLTGEADGSNEDALFYNWEQIDTGTASAVGVDTGNNALFRTFMPVSSKQRTFPKMSTLLGENDDIGELLPNSNRTLHFQFVVQNSQGVTVNDSNLIRVIKNGQQFGLHYPAPAYQKGVESNIYWEVAETNLSPVSCARVDIDLSLDNGRSFTIELASEVENKGSVVVVIPASVRDVSQARLKLSCSDNIFFSVSNRSFEITSRVVPDYTSVSVHSDDSSSQARQTSGGGSFDSIFLALFGFMIVLVRRVFRQTSSSQVASY